MLCVADCVFRRVRPVIPQAAEWQRIGNQIEAVFIFTRSHLVAIRFLCHMETDARFRTLHFLGCEAFSLTSQKDANGRSKGQVAFVGGYLSLLELRLQFYSGFFLAGFTTTSRIE